jgi:hypothetical protein
MRTDHCQGPFPTFYLSHTKVDEHELQHVAQQVTFFAANFDGGSLSSDAGLPLVQKPDRKLWLTTRLAGCIRDGRDQHRVKSDPMLELAAGRAAISGNDLVSIMLQFMSRSKPIKSAVHGRP